MKNMLRVFKKINETISLKGVREKAADLRNFGNGAEGEKAERLVANTTVSMTRKKLFPTGV